VLDEADGSFFTTRLAIQLLVAVTADLTAWRPVSSLSPIEDAAPPSDDAAPLNRSAAPALFLDDAFSGVPAAGAAEASSADWSRLEEPSPER
jgi:hypothetical protein